MIRVTLVDLDRVADIAGRGWDEIRRELKKAVGSRADELIEETRTKASVIVKEKLGRDMPKLADKLAKYIIAFMLAERD